ncbi:MAG: hypothetical protein RML95_14565 [Anaerolineae bacterium]|nr:hypothetical protein [Anaerolineae bacterium]MDW8300551.1 hypothetical protein [Anaerolineae bacterium]
MSSVTELTIPFRLPTDPATLEMRRETLITGQVASLNSNLIFERHCELAGLHWALGEPEAALENLGRALRWANENNMVEPIGYLLSLQSATLCYIGQYAAAHELFIQAEAILRRSDDELGVAWAQHLMAREYHLDLDNFMQTLRQAAAVAPVFRAHSIWHAYAESLLAQANAALGLGELRRATEALRQADGLITERNLAWLIPEAHWLRGRIALAEGAPRLAARHCYSGLNAINSGGDLRMLVPIYVTLGKALELDRSQLSAAQDAFERALMASKGRARSLHVAQAYHAAGLHLRRYSQRLTVRARASGYLYEAERRYKVLDLPMPEA